MREYQLSSDDERFEIYENQFNYKMKLFDKWHKRSRFWTWIGLSGFIPLALFCGVLSVLRMPPTWVAAYYAGSTDAALRMFFFILGRMWPVIIPWVMVIFCYSRMNYYTEKRSPL